MNRNMLSPVDDTIRVGAEWQITDLNFEPVEVGGDNWEANFQDPAFTDVPEHPWVIEAPAYSKEGLLDAKWAIEYAPIFDYPGEEREAMAYIKDPKIEISQTGIYPYNRRLGRIWLNLRSLFLSEYRVLPLTHKPDPLFAQKMIDLRKENRHQKQETLLHDQDPEDKIFPETLEAEPIIAVNGRTIMPDETVSETAEHTGWLSRKGEWIKRRRHALALGAVALGAALILSDIAQINVSPKESNPPVEALEARPQLVNIPPKADEVSDQTIDKSRHVNTASIGVTELEFLKLSIPAGGNLSWTVEYELVMRGAKEDDELAGKVANVVRYLQASKPSRDLGIVFAGEVIEVAFDQELKRLFTAV